MADVVFNGPPPGHGKKGAPIGRLRAACEARPGEWAHIEVPKGTAGNRAGYMRTLGYEAVARGDLVYAMKPVTP